MTVTFYAPAPLPWNEGARNAAVHASGLAMKEGDPSLNEIAREAQRALATEWAGVALIMDDLQYVIASSGGQIGRYERARSMTAHAILHPEEVFTLADAKADGRFGSNPFVRVGLIRFFVAAPIVDRRGFALGALCASSRSPREDFDRQAATELQALAARVADHIPT